MSSSSECAWWFSASHRRPSSTYLQGFVLMHLVLHFSRGVVRGVLIFRYCIWYCGDSDTQIPLFYLSHTMCSRERILLGVLCNVLS
ncbi:hypothetical protein P153DRAFT_198138 [Dothidotthia symphoricarpi CBS 119687]|uniref:Uncharacterized protein n=1 Tax=Dothidotthia symphoricarpi CBS 119687 TaxID=1392245 RepID=A0A6A6AM35_9PLEO|nr:uncharacterized protein P153DRAFT_198138 [Dothidotthia symphoricarpi CBS 119687]KAF2131541.1 hypothetical protein P153DRAFT_198138 [Dothidotthia symphoricarpi CBS 119687]